MQYKFEQGQKVKAKNYNSEQYEVIKYLDENYVQLKRENGQEVSLPANTIMEDTRTLLKD
jgi:hypothetical protein